MIRSVLLAFAIGGALVLSACNTVSGMGRDLQSASDSVKDATH